MSDIPLPTFCTIKQAASILLVTDRTLHNWIRAGKIRSIRVGGSRRIPVAELERLAANGTELPPIEIKKADIDAVIADRPGDDITGILTRLAAHNDTSNLDSRKQLASDALAALRTHVEQLVERLEAGGSMTALDRKTSDLLAASAAMRSRTVIVRG